MQSVKLIRIRPVEFNWIRNLSNIIQHDANLKMVILNKKIDTDFMENLMEKYPEINDHTYSTLKWTAEMTKIIIKTNSQIEKSNEGSYYRLNWNE